MIPAWKGIPRNEVPWRPAVDAAKCTGCRKCVDFCSHKVYRFDEKLNKSVVSSPYECVVGCSSCKGLCASEAISFPPLSMLKELLQAKGIPPARPA